MRKKQFVLVVDGSARDASYTSMLLQNFGYNTTVARSGEEALEFLAMAVPALVLSELVLPGMNGLDLFGRLKRHPTLPVVPPVIVQTKFADQESEDRCRRAGCAGCLNKPVQADDLYRAVQRAIEPTPRQNIRVRTHCSVSIDEVAAENEYVTVLSDGGLFVNTLEPRQVGSKHTLTFLLADRPIRVDAVVLYAYQFGEGPRKEPGMGMKFLNLSSIDRDVIQAYVRTIVDPPVLPHDAL